MTKPMNPTVIGSIDCNDFDADALRQVTKKVLAADAELIRANEKAAKEARKGKRTSEA